MIKKIALITGVTGQDGAYLAKFLLKKNYIVHGIKRRSSSFNTSRLDDIYQEKQKKNGRFFLHYGDVTDTSNICALISKIKPTEIYNLAAQSHVQVSFEIPIYSVMANSIGALNILHSIKFLNLENKIKFYQASTSEMFGNSTNKTINEKTIMEPVSPYGTSKLFSYWITKNYRDSYNIFASNGILFNHESPLRGGTFVTKKITDNVAQRIKGNKKILYLGNLYAKRDWGHAQDYVEGMWRILKYKKPDDFILATNSSITIKQFAERAFKYANINLSWKGKGLKEVGFDKKSGEIAIKIDKAYFRPNELNYLKGDYKKAFKLLKWKPKISIDNLILDMIKNSI